MLLLCGHKAWCGHKGGHKGGMAKPSSASVTTTEEPNFDTDFTMVQQLVDMTAEEHGGDPASRCVDGVWRELRRSRGEASTCSHCCVVAAAAAAAIVTTATSVIVTVTAGARGRSLRSSRRDDPGAGVAAVTSMHSKSSNSLPSSNALCVGILAGVTVAAHTAALAACATLVVLVARVAVTLAAAPAQPSLRRLRPLRPRRSARLPHRCALVRTAARRVLCACTRVLCWRVAAESLCCAVRGDACSSV